MRYGKQSVTEVECKKFGGCWENGYGCYFSQQIIPGFRMMIGECEDCKTDEVHYDLKRKDCAKLCLDKIKCNCFTYDSATKLCKIKMLFVIHQILLKTINSLIINMLIKIWPVGLETVFQEIFYIRHILSNLASISVT